jgi:hypothetical protein
MSDPREYNLAEIKKLVNSATEELKSITAEKAERMEHELGVPVYPMQFEGQTIYTVGVTCLTATRVAYRKELRHNTSLRKSLVFAGLLAGAGWGALIVNVACR